jgi:hypothetical protein
MMKTFISDLLSRLDTETIIHVGPEDEDQVLYSARINGGKWLINDAYYVEEIKPYLRPMKSMSDEEEEEFTDLAFRIDLKDDSAIIEQVDWLNAHHFDYRGLILKHLALEAPEGMYTHFGDMETIVTVEHKGNKL